MENGGHCHKAKMEGCEDLLKQELGTTTLTSYGHQQSGCINDGQGYRTDQGTVFVKFNSNSAGDEMFRGEYEGLVALRKTGELTVPKPYKLINVASGSAMLVLEYLDMCPLTDFARLGEQVARLHLHNAEQRRKARRFEQTITPKEEVTYTDKFGFHVPTYAGYSRQENEWNNDWVNFFARKMEDYINLIEQKHNDRDARPLWHTLVPMLPRLYRGICVEPSLLHGDLWRGNIAQLHQSGPATFDPIPLYGHSEFELSIMLKHGGYNQEFFDSYHTFLPKAPGFEDRYDFYSLHHHFQIWSHFGDNFVDGALGCVEPDLFRDIFGKGFKDSTIAILERLIKKCSS